MSTSDAFLLSLSLNIVKDIYVRYIRPECDDTRILSLTRVVVITIGIVACLGAAWFETVLEYAVIAYTIYGAGIFFPLLMALYWTRATRSGSLLAITAGRFLA